jgi:AcrR family transcriptional regulator
VSTNSDEGRKTNRTRQAEARREQLLDCAIAVFAEKGPEAGIKDIAGAAGVASGLIYHYFDSKEALLESIVHERNFVSPLGAFLQDAGEGDVSGTLREVALRYHQWITRVGAFILVLLQLSRSNPRLQQLMKANVLAQFQTLADYLDGRIAAGQLRPHDSKVAAQGLLYSIFTGWQMVQVSPEFASGLAELLYQGLRPD